MKARMNPPHSEGVLGSMLNGIAQYTNARYICLQGEGRYLKRYTGIRRLVLRAAA